MKTLQDIIEESRKLKGKSLRQIAALRREYLKRVKAERLRKAARAEGKER